MSKPKSDPRKPSFPERVDGADFERIFEAEREFVAGEDPELKALAVSGGGIRSASFGLGIMQALVAGDRLKDFHYLSTVSGGGYLGTSLMSTATRSDGLERPDGSPGVM